MSAAERDGDQLTLRPADAPRPGFGWPPAARHGPAHSGCRYLRPGGSPLQLGAIGRAYGRIVRRLDAIKLSEFETLLGA